MLIYYSTAGETVIIVFLNVVVHQKRLFSIETLAKKYFKQAVYALLLDGAPKGDFNFSFMKKNAPAFLLLHGFLLGQKNNISHNIQNVW